MSRLNKATREAIINKAIEKSGVLAREEVLISRRAKLADDVRLFAIGGAEAEKKLDSDFEKVRKQLKKLDDGFFKHTSLPAPRADYDVDVNFAGRAVRLHFNGMERNQGKAEYKNYIKESRVVITADNQLNDEFDKIEIEQRAVNDLRAHVNAEVSAMVNSVTTVKKLIEVWPESKELIPKFEREQLTSLVVSVDNLNAMIGLPSDK